MKGVDREKDEMRDPWVGWTLPPEIETKRRDGEQRVELHQLTLQRLANLVCEWVRNRLSMRRRHF